MYCRALLCRFGYKEASCFGHALEGNLHLVFAQVGKGGGTKCGKCEPLGIMFPRWGCSIMGRRRNCASRLPR